MTPQPFAEPPIQPLIPLRRTLAHAAQHSPYYRDQAWAARLRAGHAVALEDVPITSKEAVRDTTAAFYAAQVPDTDGPAAARSTSGSTGIALRILKTRLHFDVNARENLRLKRGWGFERHDRALNATNRDQPEKDGLLEERRGASGKVQWTLYSFNSQVVGKAVLEKRPTLLSTRPNVVKGILLDFPEIDFLQLISTVSECLPDDLPALIARIPGCAHFDLYGAVETGAMAGLCKHCGLYHIAARQVIIELLDEAGRPAGPGEMGRVVVTTLHNLAMPFIRYDIGDYAVRARTEACDGTGLALEKIVGRRRDLFKLPDGSRMLPYPMGEEASAYGIIQCKFVQIALGEVELRYVTADPAAEISQAEAQDIVNRTLSPQLRAIPVKVDSLPVRAGAKYVMHESLI